MSARDQFIEALDSDFEAATRLLRSSRQAPRATQAAATEIVVREKDAPCEERVGEQMKMFPQAVAALPQEFGRVALFGVPSDSVPRKMLSKVKLEGRGDVEIVYTGEELGAKEETLWLACLRLGRGRPMGERIYTTMASLAREVGLQRGGGKRGTIGLLKSRLDRLSLAHLIITVKRGGNAVRITTGLLKWGLNEESGAMYIRLDPDASRLFESMGYQPWEMRISLRSDVAARVMSYACSHANGKHHCVRLNDLRRWCGYGGRLSDWKAACKKAVSKLEASGLLEPGSTKFETGPNGPAVSWKRAELK